MLAEGRKWLKYFHSNEESMNHMLVSQKQHKSQATYIWLIHIQKFTKKQYSIFINID